MTISEHSTFRIVVKGKPNTAVSQDAITRLASRLSATPKQIEHIIGSPHYVLARGLTEAKAEAYLRTLEENGVAAVVEDEGELLAVELPDHDQGVARAEPVGSGEAIVRRIADYQKGSGIAWIILAVIQVLTVYGILAGIWNLCVGISRIRHSGQIRRREETVPAAFQGISGLVIAGVVNLVLGGVIGVVLVGFDFYVRDKVLSNQQLFDQPAAAEAAYENKKAARLARAAAKGY